MAGLPVEVLAAPPNGAVSADVAFLGVPLAADVDARAWYETMRKSIPDGPASTRSRSASDRSTGREAFLLRASSTDRARRHVTSSGAVRGRAARLARYV